MSNQKHSLPIAAVVQMRISVRILPLTDSLGEITTRSLHGIVFLPWRESAL